MINQQVALENLEALGFVVEVANHGKEAIEKIEANKIDFDLVLMDLQMPVMDGMTATTLIREKLNAERTPDNSFICRCYG